MFYDSNKIKLETSNRWAMKMSPTARTPAGCRCKHFEEHLSISYSIVYKTLTSRDFLRNARLV